MKTKLGDVIHLYLGQRVFVPETNKEATLTGISLVPGGRDVIVDVHYSDSVDDWDVFNDNLDEFDRVKPILRRLNDITIEEAAHVLQQTYFEHITYPMSDYQMKLNDSGNPVISIDNNWWDHSLTFGVKTGSIWSTDKGPIYNTKLRASIFRYLISRSFDLFGLIDSQQAIDRATITPSPTKNEQV